MKLDDHRQELFDRVAAHLLNQGERSYEEEAGCRYRQDDLRCAVGCLIDDPHYDEKLEGKVVSHHLVSEAVESSLGFILNEHERNLLYALQDVHDSHYPEGWHNMLVNVARGYGLSTDVLRSDQ